MGMRVGISAKYRPEYRGEPLHQAKIKRLLLLGVNTMRGEIKAAGKKILAASLLPKQKSSPNNWERRKCLKQYDMLSFVAASGLSAVLKISDHGPFSEL